MPENILFAVLSVFFTVFLLEIGDKTQVATILFAAEQRTPSVYVFVAASAALVLTTALAVFLGYLLQTHLSGLPIKLVAGIAFIGVGSLTILEHFRA